MSDSMRSRADDPIDRWEEPITDAARLDAIHRYNQVAQEVRDVINARQDLTDDERAALCARLPTEVAGVPNAFYDESIRRETENGTR